MNFVLLTSTDGPVVWIAAAHIIAAQRIHNNNSGFNHTVLTLSGNRTLGVIETTEEIFGKLQAVTA